MITTRDENVYSSTDVDKLFRLTRQANSQFIKSAGAFVLYETSREGIYA